MNWTALLVVIGSIIFITAISAMLWLLDEFTPRNFFDE